MDKAFIATEGNLQSSSVIFSSPEALAHTKWREALENPLVSKRICAIVVVWCCRPFPDRSLGKGSGDMAIPKLFWWNTEVASIIS